MFGEEEKVEDAEFDGNVPAEAPVEEAEAVLPGDESEAAPSIDDQLREEAAAEEEAVVQSINYFAFYPEEVELELPPTGEGEVQRKQKAMLENFIPYVKFSGLNSAKDGTLSGALTFTGSNTHSGTETFTGPVVLTGQQLENVEVVTATNVIAASESGKTFFLNAAAGFESTLPTAALGLYFRFIVKTAPTSVGFTITGSPADKIYGTIACSGAEDTINGVTANQADNVILVHNVALIGDLLEFYADETNWYVTGNVNTYAAVTANG